MVEARKFGIIISMLADIVSTLIVLSVSEHWFCSFIIFFSISFLRFFVLFIIFYFLSGLIL